MPVFRDTDHLYQVLSALFERVRAEPTIANRLLEGNLGGSRRTRTWR